MLNTLLHLSRGPWESVKKFHPFRIYLYNPFRKATCRTYKKSTATYSSQVSDVWTTSFPFLCDRGLKQFLFVLIAGWSSCLTFGREFGSFHENNLVIKPNWLQDWYYGKRADFNGLKCFEANCRISSQGVNNIGKRRYFCQDYLEEGK